MTVVTSLFMAGYIHLLRHPGSVPVKMPLTDLDAAIPLQPPMMLAYAAWMSNLCLQRAVVRLHCVFHAGGQTTRSAGSARRRSAGAGVCMAVATLAAPAGVKLMWREFKASSAIPVCVLGVLRHHNPSPFAVTYPTAGLKPMNALARRLPGDTSRKQHFFTPHSI